MSWLSNFMNPGGGYKKAQKQYDKYYEQAQNYQKPYNQFGQGQQQTLQDYINSLKDPQALQDKWASGYKESEAAKNMEQMAQQHGLDAASSMGLMGSNTAVNAIQSGTTGIAAQDRQNYLNDLMQKYMAGAGLSQGVYGTGAQAAGQQANNAMQQGDRSAQMAYGQYQAPANMFGKGVGAATGLATDWLTGGFGKGGYGRGVWSTGGS